MLLSSAINISSLSGVDFVSSLYAECHRIKQAQICFGQACEDFNLETKISNLNMLQLICQDQWDTIA
jgi:hypothetical protein